MLSNMSQRPAFWNVVGDSTFNPNINIHASLFGINNNITNNNRMDNSLFWGGGVLVNNDNTSIALFGQQNNFLNLGLFWFSDCNKNNNNNFMVLGMIPFVSLFRKRSNN